jgi:response regulator aspartate phosphatase I
MFADVENFSIEFAYYFHAQGNLMLSNEYYRMSVEARRDYFVISDFYKTMS